VEHHRAMLQKLYRPRIASNSENRFDINLNCQLPMLDIFLNICSVSVLTFIGQVKLVSVGNHKRLILPIFMDTSHKNHGLLVLLR